MAILELNHQNTTTCSCEKPFFYCARCPLTWSCETCQQSQQDTTNNQKNLLPQSSMQKPQFSSKYTVYLGLSLTTKFDTYKYTFGNCPGLCWLFERGNLHSCPGHIFNPSAVVNHCVLGLEIYVKMEIFTISGLGSSLECVCCCAPNWCHPAKSLLGLAFISFRDTFFPVLSNMGTCFFLVCGMCGIQCTSGSMSSSERPSHFYYFSLIKYWDGTTNWTKKTGYRHCRRKW